MMLIQVRPESMGTVRLTSDDPREASVIDPEYLTADSDIGPLVEEGKLVREVADTDPMGPTAGRRSNRGPM
jgi:choline dehydrogenase-like flavoprotein